MARQKIIAVVGPTASGKSSLGVWLAKKLGGEIISADSRQVYKGLDIGTGKITKKEMQGVKHHLLSIVSPKKQFTVDDFVKKSTEAITSIYRSKKMPLVVGGTGLYVDMLLGRTAYPNVPPNPALRVALEKKSLAQLFAQLKKLDPRRAANIEPGHKRRIIRAIEVATAVGKSPSKLETINTTNNKYNVLWLGLSPTPDKLKQNIRIRLRSRMKAGMVAEAKRLHKAGLSYKRMEELGLEYRSLARYLQNKISKNELEKEIENGNWQYAKRQMRWFKRNKDIRWINSKFQALKLSKQFLSGHK